MNPVFHDPVIYAHISSFAIYYIGKKPCILTQNSIPSLKTFIAILNSLSCSADEILCDELSNAEHTYSSEISVLLEDCNSQELMIMTDTLASLKNSLRKQPSYLQSP